MPDRRNLKTKRAIKDAFLSQLKSKNLNQISVTKIAKAANIGRGTFYLHYLDVYDLYEKLVNDFYTEMEVYFDNAYPTTIAENLKKLINEVINFISDNKAFFLIMLRLEGSEKTISKIKSFFNKKLIQESIQIFDNEILDAQYLNIESIFIVSGIVGVIENWVNEGLTVQNEKLTEYLYKIIMTLNNSFDVNSI